jgi:hypothetical protein
VWAPSGSAYNNHSRALIEEFLKARYAGGEPELGPAIVEAMEAYATPGVETWPLKTFNLLGDPAMTVRGP